MGAFNRSAIVTVVERRSRFLLLGDLPEGHDAQSVYECLIEVNRRRQRQRTHATSGSTMRPLPSPRNLVQHRPQRGSHQSHTSCC